MNLKLAHLGDLTGMHFNILYYQSQNQYPTEGRSSTLFFLSYHI